jgi:hypothetical protein
VRVKQSRARAPRRRTRVPPRRGARGLRRCRHASRPRGAARQRRRGAASRRGARHLAATPHTLLRATTHAAVARARLAAAASRAPQIQSLKNLGLDISRADLEGGSARNRFYITDAKARATHDRCSARARAHASAHKKSGSGGATRRRAASPRRAASRRAAPRPAATRTPSRRAGAASHAPRRRSCPHTHAHTHQTLSQALIHAPRSFFHATQTSDKIVLSERLEEIRATIINNMLAYHPESRDSLAAGRKPPADGGAKVLGTRPPSAIPTTISIKPQASGARSALELTTTDRPGLLVDVVRVLKDCSLNVVSASINTVVRALH